VIEGNVIGLDSTGVIAIPNAKSGVELLSAGTTVGGNSASAANVISGNTVAGVSIEGPAATGNSVVGNLIGTDSTGSAAVGNAYGVRIVSGASSNSVWHEVSHPNVISGNGVGILIADAGTQHNKIYGNRIGTDPAGGTSLGNTGQGILIQDANDNFIGAGSASHRNIVSGNGGDGIRIEGSGSTTNQVLGNYIGTDDSGLAALPNAGNGVHVLDGATGNEIGSAAGAYNLISGNIGSGVKIEGDTTTATTVHGNWIGLDATGATPFANSGYGVEILSSGGNLVGGPTAGDRNIFTGSNPDLWVEKTMPSLVLAPNTIQGNWFGLSASGSTVIGSFGSSAAIITFDGNVFDGNVIVGAQLSGLRLFSSGGTLIRGNLIGLTPGFAPGGNGQAGIWIVGPSSDGNVIGGPTSQEWNVIAFNGEDGIRIETGNVGNEISGNYTFDNGDLGIDLENDGVTANDAGDADTGANNRQNFPVLTSATTTGGSVTVSGTLDSAPNTSFAVQIYRNSTCDPSGHGEGLEPIGTAIATTDSAGNAAFTGTFLAFAQETELLTGVATSLAGGDSSEFSMCAGMSGVPPEPVGEGGFSSAPGASNVLSWPESPGATSYHVYSGTLGTLPLLASGSLTVLSPLQSGSPDSCEVGATGTTSLATAVTEIPPPGEMLWYLVVPEGDYGLGGAGDGASGPRTQESIGACGASCAHDTCTLGIALTSPCNACVAMVGAVDPYCTGTAWDAVCVQEVRTVCGSMRCAESAGSCGHPLCSQGGLLAAGCDAPPLGASCVAKICAVDPYCCGTAWDGVCVDEVATVCTMGCL